MQVIQNIHANGQTVPAWLSVGRVATVTALAAIIFLAVWSPISAEVTQGEGNSPGIEFGGASLAVGNEHDDRAKKADRLARDHDEWLRTAHRKAAFTAEEQPLPAQF